MRFGSLAQPSESVISSDVMGKFLKYGILALLAYFVWQKAPELADWATNLGSGLNRKSVSISQGLCVSAAERASETFSRGLRDFSKPPFDLDAWDLFREKVTGEIYNADSRCDCARSSCLRAADALAELNGLLADFNNSLRGEGVPLNPARRQETIDRFLKRAREFDRQGD